VKGKTFTLVGAYSTFKCLSFYKADGTLVAFFDKSAVRNWREMNESELPTN